MSGSLDLPRWVDFALRMRSDAVSIISTTEIRLTANGINDPIIYAATLLFRTIRSCHAVFMLAATDDLVEANMLARSCVENVLWLRGLEANGLDFVKQILDDGLRSEASLAELVTSLPDIKLDPETEGLAAQQIAMKTKTRIEIAKISKSANAKMDYSVFRMISNNYAHPSPRSLDCHIVPNTETGLFDLQMEPKADAEQLAGAMFVAAGAVITALGLFLELFPDEAKVRFETLGHEKTISRLVDDLKALSREAGIDGSN